MERRRQANSPNDADLADYTFPVGVVVGFHGLAGQVKIKPSTNNPELLTDLSSVKVRFRAGLKKPEEILRVRSCKLDRKTLLLQFDGYKDRTSVDEFTGAELFTRETELLPLEDEEFWVKDLVGVEAYTTVGDLIGTVCSIIPGATDVLEIQPAEGPKGKTILVPFVKTLVPVVDMKRRRVEIDAIDGLLEPQ